MLTHGSLFSGIGGFDLGFERAGIQTIWQVEIDRYCRAVLAKHFPKAKRYRNIKRFTSCRSLEPVDIITGGFPCQPVSEAGKRAGPTDDRWLWPEMRRVISVLKPTWVVAENVRGLLSLNAGVVFESVLLDLEGEGYDVQTLVIPAAGVGATHRRDRVWIVAHANGRGGQATQLPIRQARQDQAEAVADGTGADAPDPAQQQMGIAGQPRFDGGLAGMDAADAVPQRRQRRARVQETSQTDGRIPAQGMCAWGPPQPVLRRVDAGLSRKLDDGRTVWEARISALGNTIVPQIAEAIGRMIIAVEGAT